MKKLIYLFVVTSIFLSSCSNNQEKGFTACDCIGVLSVPKSFVKGTDKYKWDVCKRKFLYATNARKKCPSYKNSNQGNASKSRAELNNITSLIINHSYDINIIDSLNEFPDPNDVDWIRLRSQLKVGDALYIFQEGTWVYNSVNFVLLRRKTKKLVWWKECLTTLFGAEFKDLTECCESDYIRETNVCSNCQKDNMLKKVTNNTSQDEEEYTQEEEYIEEEEYTEEEEYFDEVFNSVENMPEFPDGKLGLMKFIQKNIIYPPAAKEYNITGKVYVSYIVDKAGNVRNVKIIRGVDKNLDAEAARVIRSLPKYRPGKQKGKVVNVMFTIPINFTLN